jgi:hypothetical protein
MTESPAQARRRRIATIRRRIAATSLATFAMAFGVISWTGSMGSAAATTGAPRTATATSTATATTTAGDSSAATDNSAATDSSSGLAPVTTRQS